VSATTLNLSELTERLLSALDARAKDIISRRYGIKTGSPETLESIGKEYGITRERVRQIQSQAKKALVELEELLTPVRALFEDAFAEYGGVLSEDHAVLVIQERLAATAAAQQLVVFYLDVLPPYEYVTRDSLFAPHWRHPSVVSDQGPAVVKAARTTLKRVGHPVPADDLIEEVQQSLAAGSGTLPERHIRAQLMASKHVHLTPFGEWGLAGWPETNPRGVGDKAYAVMRRHGKPEHFTAITDLINEAAFDHKRANPQTVHNELIKDARFVLVGRGLYGLTEWGYIPGTVADVIESLLKEAGQPLTRDEVIEKVLAQRKVKKNTILLGLQNQKRFVRTSENRYTLRQRA